MKIKKKKGIYLIFLLQIYINFIAKSISPRVSLKFYSDMLHRFFRPACRVISRALLVTPLALFSRKSIKASTASRATISAPLSFINFRIGDQANLKGICETLNLPSLPLSLSFLHFLILCCKVHSL